MKKSRIIIVSSALFAVMALSSMTALASVDVNQRNGAWHGQIRTTKLSADKKIAVSEKVKAINKAFETSDYNAWLTAIGKDSPIAQKITLENFPKLVDIHNLEQQLEAKRKELGMDSKGDFFGLAHHKGLIKK
ncbi:MAG: hypothetical protein NT091_03975 [Candidatus Falkowbacteria bacterium]|nr:hypothetical protein [Candidatus Falkowbacteria bacterium]